MHRRRLFWQIFPAQLFVTLAVLLAVTGLATAIIRDVYEKHIAVELQTRIGLIESGIRAALVAGDEAAVDRLAKSIGRQSRMRITVLAPDGRVLGDTAAEPARMENHAGRPEVIEALREDVGRSLRYSRTVDEDFLYVAVLIRREDHEPLAILRASLPLDAAGSQLSLVREHLPLAAALIAMSALLSLWISRRLARPLEQMRHVAERFAQGDLDTRLPVTRTEEIAGLAEAMKHMALQLNQRIRAEARRRNEQQAVLSSMVEGVLAIDAGERILNLNEAAARLLGLGGDAVHGRTIQEVIRNVDLQRFIQRALASAEPIEDDIVVFGEGQRYLRANAAVLHDAETKPVGTVVVLHDMTRLRHLEHLRREFVANVSHELRTPITSIKGFAETLLETGTADREESGRFLRIIARQADRLNAIIEDLLALARIEQDAEHGEIVRAPGSVREILMSAIQICAHKSDAKNIAVALECDEPIRAEINAPLIEQAVVNLIDNAVKYSEPGTSVRVAAWANGDGLRIQVADQGCGIEHRHLPRLFERFYRVDKARSRKLGGTGLGLAIVKHIAEAHRGAVEVESDPGKGSRFTIVLPKTG
jgi:two-component system phosphate regulon sensor histidine kinase PhoR